MMIASVIIGLQESILLIEMFRKDQSRDVNEIKSLKDDQDFPRVDILIYRRITIWLTKVPDTCRPRIYTHALLGKQDTVKILFSRVYLSRLEHLMGAAWVSGWKGPLGIRLTCS